MWRRIYFLACIILVAGVLFLGSGGNSLAALGTGNAQFPIWHDISEASIPLKGTRLVVPNNYRTVAADPAALGAALAAAPVEISPGSGVRGSNAVFQLPMPDGAMQRFVIVSSSVMESSLAARYPSIKTYLGQGLDDRTASVRMDYTPLGFHALVLSASGATYIDPYSQGDTTNYISYYDKDYSKPADKTFTELSSTVNNVAAHPAAHGATPPVPAGPTLRTYRLALAATAEYTIFQSQPGPADKTKALAAMVTTVNRVVGVYEKEVAIRLVLIANDDRLIYTDPANEPYTNNNGEMMLTQNQTNVDNIVGSGNYDIGHVFSTGGGGIAGLGVVCDNMQKAMGVTGSDSPVGDPFDIDYVAHEMGHQFGGSHTFNATTGSCAGNRAADHAWETGSGSTIISYAGICAPENLQAHSDPYFFTGTFDDIMTYTTSGTGATCPVNSATGNNPPAVNAGATYTIPANTYFKLTGSATDPDNDALTYGWEEFDLGTAAPPEGDDGSRPLFRSFLPTTSPSRYFPQLSDILTKNDGQPSFGEWLPTTNRTMQFRLTARDNRAGGGGVNYSQTSVTVSNGAGPFRVTAPNTAVTWQSGSAQTVMWDVANTNQAPVSCPAVNIALSADGGQTYPVILAAGAPNTGSDTIAAPNITTGSARVIVACANNIFLDTSNVNFTVTGGPTVTPTSTSVGGNPSPTSTVPAVGSPSATPTQPPAGCQINFVDVQANSPFYSYIQCLACRNIIGGYACGSAGEPCNGSNDPYFRPGLNVTRGQISKMVSLAAVLTGDTGGQRFEDVAPGSPFYDPIQQLAARSDINGYTCGGPGEPCGAGNLPYFRPGANTTRGQLSKIVSQAANFQGEPGEQRFTDAAPDSPFFQWIQRLANRNVISGYACGGDNEPCDPQSRPYFRSNANVTRGQTAKIVSNTFEPACQTAAPARK